MTEPMATASILVIGSVLVLLAIWFSRTSDRFGLPVMLAFLAVGMLAGEEGPGGIHFSDYHASFRMASFALTMILFDGGLNTPVSMVRPVWRPATTLSTLGVLLVAGACTLCGRWLGFRWGQAALLGSVVSCTDAAAVFALLRSQKLRLQRRVGGTLELEAGLNDPMAVALTLAVTEALTPGKSLEYDRLLWVPAEFLIGALVGWAIGRLGGLLIRRANLSTPSLYPVISLAIAALGFGLPTLVHGSGFLGVYVAGLVLGREETPHRAELVRIHGAFAWIAQVGMFLMLGLLISPSHLMQVALPAAGLALFLIFLARPFAVALCLTPFGYSGREIAYIGWVGLRGAVPIVLATIPVMARIPGSESLFHAVFFMVVVGSFLPGSTVRWVTRALGLNAHDSEPHHT